MSDVERKAMRTDLGGDARSMARGAGVNLVGSVGAAGIGFLVMIATTHLISASAIGLVAIGTTVVGLAVIPSLLGLDTGVIRFVARRAALGDERGARASIQSSLALSSVTSFALTAILWWKAPEICERFFRKPDATEIMRLVTLSLPALAVGRIAISAVQGYGFMAYPAWLGVLRRILRFGALLPLVAVGLEARALAIASVVSAWGACALAFYFLLRVHTHALAPVRGWPVGALLNFSLPQLMTGLLFYAIIWTDTLLLGRLGTASDVGVYVVLATLLGPATLVSTAVGQMFAPRIAAEDARGDRVMLGRMLKRVTHWNTTVSLPFFALLVLVPAGLLGLFGGNYERGATALAILAAGQLLNTVAGPLGQVINMSGRQYLTMSNNALVAGLNAAACLVLIPRYGITGAASATAGSLTLVNLIKLVEVKLLFGMHPFQRQTLWVFASGIAAVAATLPIVFLPAWPSGLVEAAAGGIVLFAAYALIAWGLALTDEDREIAALGRDRLRQGMRSGRLAAEA